PNTCQSPRLTKHHVRCNTCSMTYSDSAPLQNLLAMRPQPTSSSMATAASGPIPASGYTEPKPGWLPNRPRHWLSACLDKGENDWTKACPLGTSRLATHGSTPSYHRSQLPDHNCPSDCHPEPNPPSKLWPQNGQMQKSGSTYSIT